MSHVSVKQTAKRETKRPPAGYTLMEMVIATASAVVLMGGLSSALYIGAQSLDVNTGSRAETRTANAALASIKRDLQSALLLSELTTTSVTMTVPDRDNDTVVETIRYAWAGSADDPLTQEYNGTMTTLAENVQSFSLDWLKRLIEGTSTRPFVLFVSSEAPDAVTGITTPSATEQERINLIEGWGFVVRVISQEASLSGFNCDLALTNVVYVSGETVGWAINTKLNPVTHGVVTESFANADALGFYNGVSVDSNDKTTINITNERHYLTNEYSVGTLTVADTDLEMKKTSSSLAPAALKLASIESGSAEPSLLILDADDQLADGTFAAGRRCQLPWGEGGFDSTQLNLDGEKLMRRAIEWAAGAGEDSATDWVQYQEFTETQVGNNATSITLNTPTDSSEGDLLIAVVATDGDTEGSLGPPAGWSEILVEKDRFSRVTLGVWWKLVDASEPATSQFSWSGSERAYGTIMRFTGHDPNNPIHAIAANAGVSNSPTAPALVTTVDDCLILRIGCFDDDDVINGNAGMPGHTTITAGESDNSNFSTSAAAAYQMQAHAGNCGTAMFALNGNEEYRTLTIAIPDNPN